MIYLSESEAHAIGLSDFASECARAGLPTPVPEFRFHATRRWRFDWAFLDVKLAVEIDGGAWTGGRHTRGSGYRKDIEKLAEAMCQGWIVLRVMPEHIDDGRALMWIQRILEWRTEQR